MKHFSKRNLAFYCFYCFAAIAFLVFFSAEQPFVLTNALYLKDHIVSAAG